MSCPHEDDVLRLFDGDLEPFRAEILAAVAKRDAEMRDVSPAGHLGGLRAPVFLLHGAGDTVIPSTETEWLATHVPARRLRAVLVSPAIVHVELESPTLGQKAELVHFMGAHGVPTLVVATKADKLSKGERGLVPRTIAEQLGCHSGDIVLTSALAGDGLGDDGRRGGLAAELAALVAPREPARDEEESPREPARDDNETALAAEPPEAERRAGG